MSDRHGLIVGPGGHVLPLKIENFFCFLVIMGLIIYRENLKIKPFLCHLIIYTLSGVLFLFLLYVCSINFVV